MEQVLKVDGMSCQHCAKAVREALEEVPGVAAAHVDLDGGEVRVETEEGVPASVLIRAVEDAGYEVLE